MSSVKLLRFSREVHKWVGLVLSLVFLLLSVTGVMLLFKDQWGFQPSTQKGEKAEITQSLSIDKIVSIAVAQGYDDLKSVEDVDRIDFRPNKSVYKVWSNDGREIQVDMTTGKVLSVGQRTDKLLENLHDGSFFGDWFKYIVVTASGISLILLTFSGYYIWGYTFIKRKNSNKQTKVQRKYA